MSYWTFDPRPFRVMHDDGLSINDRKKIILVYSLVLKRVAVGGVSGEYLKEGGKCR